MLDSVQKLPAWGNTYFFEIFLCFKQRNSNLPASLPPNAHPTPNLAHPLNTPGTAFPLLLRLRWGPQALYWQSPQNSHHSCPRQAQICPCLHPSPLGEEVQTQTVVANACELGRCPLTPVARVCAPHRLQILGPPPTGDDHKASCCPWLQDEACF